MTENMKVSHASQFRQAGYGKTSKRCKFLGSYFLLLQDLLGCLPDFVLLLQPNVDTEGARVQDENAPG